MMNRYILLLFYLVCSCKNDKYNGYVYDTNCKPLKDVTIYNIHSKKATITNEAGYFELDKNHDVSSKLIFKKDGFSIDTIVAIEIRNGEQQKERFTGEVIFLLSEKYKDSIYKINGSK
ncbi:hypothetical protein ASE40_06540 [Flavobacterium sp. Root935]|uniref:carboxypeptidase-like regulatory domain-containing protein n=1 Tax=Flavobacterium sp. Root935 TaxID=1736610 RepID=UPI0007098F3E|nr:carboxypeptidase-like regulatory domain-containing protein [Flavobacterium sp. Root935]KRD61203.1 hypothetical protein ASE40_06540 [Flavobacterium sp. Root935]